MIRLIVVGIVFISRRPLFTLRYGVNEALVKAFNNPIRVIRIIGRKFLIGTSCAPSITRLPFLSLLADFSFLPRTEKALYFRTSVTLESRVNISEKKTDAIRPGTNISLGMIYMKARWSLIMIDSGAATCISIEAIGQFGSFSDRLPSKLPRRATNALK